MKKNILLWTNILVCLIILVGFLLTTVLSYRANYSSSLSKIEQVSSLASEGIYYQLNDIFTEPLTASMTMANDSLLGELLAQEEEHLSDQDYLATVKNYLNSYKEAYDYDSVFLVSTKTNRYYNYNGLDRVLTPDNPENTWYYSLLASGADHSIVVDNDEVAGAENRITVFINCVLQDENGEAQGIVGVGLSLDYLQGLLRKYERDFEVQALLIDQTGTIEISPKNTSYQAVNWFDLRGYGEEVREKSLACRDKEEACSFWASGGGDSEKKSYIVARYVSNLNWYLIVERDTSSLVAELQKQFIQTLVIIAAIIIIILLVITFVIRGFNRRIVSLIQSNEEEKRNMFQKATEELFENIYELDITNNCPANKATEDYFAGLGAPPGTPYDQALSIVAEQQIKEEFRQGYITTFAPENVLSAYQKGCETLRYDFMISTGGDYYWMRITARIMQRESDGTVHMLTYRQNIDAEKCWEQRMRELAQTDEMTGLYTKTATARHITELLASEPQANYALFMLDIDNFKEANDKFGHGFGDLVIEAFAQALEANFTESGVIGRLGGDEFAAFILAPDETWVKHKAQHLLENLNWDYSKDGNSWHISTSIGIALAPQDGDNFAELYKRADKALYSSKKQGRNTYTLYGDL